jgi:hypothetical protein
MRHQIPTAVLATLLPLGLLAGCGDGEPARGTDLTQAQLEEHVNGSFEPDDPAKELEAACEGALEAVAEATQDCEVTNGNQRVGVRASVTDVEADDLGMQLTPFLFGEDVAGAISQSLEMQGYTGISTTCDGDLVGEVGRELECVLISDTGESVVNVDVTKVDGLMIDYDFESA